MNEVRASKKRERLLYPLFLDRSSRIIHSFVVGFPAARKVALFPYNGNKATSRRKNDREREREKERGKYNGESKNIESYNVG